MFCDQLGCREWGFKWIGKNIAGTMRATDVQYLCRRYHDVPLRRSGPNRRMERCSQCKSADRR